MRITCLLLLRLYNKDSYLHFIKDFWKAFQWSIAQTAEKYLANLIKRWKTFASALQFMPVTIAVQNSRLLNRLFRNLSWKNVIVLPISAMQNVLNSIRYAFLLVFISVRLLYVAEEFLLFSG
jgi:hypothetical protein